MQTQRVRHEVPPPYPQQIPYEPIHPRGDWYKLHEGYPPLPIWHFRPSGGDKLKYAQNGAKRLILVLY